LDNIQPSIPITALVIATIHFITTTQIWGP
jgi:hypothetical protein